MSRAIRLPVNPREAVGGLFSPSFERVWTKADRRKLRKAKARAARRRKR